MTRHESRELAFILVFEKGFQDEMSVIELIENALELELFPENAFAENLARKVYDNITDIDNIINENLICTIIPADDCHVRRHAAGYDYFPFHYTSSSSKTGT